MLLKRVLAKRILDSRGEPTIEVHIRGCKASSPSGKSKGKYENIDFFRSIGFCVNLLNKTDFNLDINSFEDLKKVEDFLAVKLKLKEAKQIGANVLFALESAILKALAKSKNKPLWYLVNPQAKNLPVPIGNSIGGGLHSHNKEKPEFQEFLIIPRYKEIDKNAMLMRDIYKKIGRMIKTNGKNDEGAWQTYLSNEEIFTFLSKFNNIKIGVDIAASTFYKNKTYSYNNKSFNREEQVSYINSLIKNYNLYYIEDPLDEEDFEGFSKIQRKNSLVIGDDLTATQLPRLRKAINAKSINAMIIKPNQNGSLFELKKIFETCKKHKIKTILSHRSGETLDNALADYAFGFQADFIKTGISTKWREVKLNRLIEIEKEIKNL